MRRLRSNGHWRRMRAVAAQHRSTRERLVRLRRSPRARTRRRRRQRRGPHLARRTQRPQQPRPYPLATCRPSGSVFSASWGSEAPAPARAASACVFSAPAERSVQHNTFATWKFAKNALSCPDGSLPHHRRVKLPIDRGSTAWRHLPRRRYQALFFASAEGIRGRFSPAEPSRYALDA